MQTVFSHIIQKRFSRINEDVATDALSFILHSSESARNGIMKLLRGLVGDLPDLRFRTQQTENSIRPDMWGFHKTEPRVDRVFRENLRNIKGSVAPTKHDHRFPLMGKLEEPRSCRAGHYRSPGPGAAKGANAWR
jgi:hypothetical protein